MIRHGAGWGEPLSQSLQFPHRCPLSHFDLQSLHISMGADWMLRPSDTMYLCLQSLGGSSMNQKSLATWHCIKDQVWFFDLRYKNMFLKQGPGKHALHHHLGHYWLLPHRNPAALRKMFSLGSVSVCCFAGDTVVISMPSDSCRRISVELGFPCFWWFYPKGEESPLANFRNLKL